jgi:PAS domain S-box-containing protein
MADTDHTQLHTALQSEAPDVSEPIEVQGMSLALALAVMAILYATSFINYLLFHSLAELFAITIAVAIFIIAWNTRRLMDNNYMLVLGIALLFVAGIALLHTLAYKGMDIFIGYDANLPTQLWIAGRYLLAISLVIAPFTLHRRLNANAVLIGYTTVFLLIVSSIFIGPIFPDCYVEGIGLTQFKLVSEYIISLLLVAGALLIYQQRDHFEQGVQNVLILAIAIMVASELAFTFYIGVFDLSNLIGHLLMVASFCLVYLALVQMGLRRPYTILFRGLDQSNKDLEREKGRIEQYLDIAGVMFVALERNGTVRLINRKGSQILKSSEKDTLGRDWFSQFVPERARSSAREVFMQILEGKTGASLFESPILTADGEERLISWHHSPITDAEGAITGMLSSGEDITDTRNAEEALRLANSKLNLLSSITRHDILNQITAAEGYLGFAEEDVSDETTRRYLKNIHTAVSAIQRQIEFTSDYQDMGVRKPEWQAPGDLARRSAEQLRLPEEITLTIDLDGLRVYADPMLNKVFYNLMDNAVKHAGQFTRIGFRSEIHDGTLAIICEDNGKGVPFRDKETIFKPGYKRRHSHGLFLVAEILSITGLSIRETGVPGDGARFEILVPPGSYRFRGGIDE